MAVRKFHGACPPPCVVGDGIAYGRKRFHHFQIHVGVRFGSDDAYRPRAAKETCGFGRRFHSGGKPDALDRPAGKAFQSFQADSARCAPRLEPAMACTSSTITVSTAESIRRALEVSSRNSDSGVVTRISGGWLTILAPFLRRGVAASYAHADFRRWAVPSPRTVRRNARPMAAWRFLATSSAQSLQMAKYTGP